MNNKVKSKATRTAPESDSDGEISQHDIEFAAYCIWNQEGRIEGHDLDHWLRAEKLLREAKRKAGLQHESH